MHFANIMQHLLLFFFTTLIENLRLSSAARVVYKLFLNLEQKDSRVLKNIVLIGNSIS